MLVASRNVAQPMEVSDCNFPFPLGPPAAVVRVVTPTVLNQTTAFHPSLLDFINCLEYTGQVLEVFCFVCLFLFVTCKRFMLYN